MLTAAAACRQQFALPAPASRPRWSDQSDGDASAGGGNEEEGDDDTLTLLLGLLEMQRQTLGVGFAFGFICAHPGGCRAMNVIMLAGRPCPSAAGENSRVESFVKAGGVHEAFSGKRTEFCRIVLCRAPPHTVCVLLCVLFPYPFTSTLPPHFVAPLFKAANWAPGRHPIIGHVRLCPLRRRSAGCCSWFC